MPESLDGRSRGIAVCIYISYDVILPPQKEPKLARAKHIPEWEEYDSEVARLTRRLAEEGVIQSGLAVADANVLADVGAGKVTVDEETSQDSNQQAAEQVILHPKDEL